MSQSNENTQVPSEEKRSFILIETLPKDFIKDSDFNITEDIILELDF